MSELEGTAAEFERSWGGLLPVKSERPIDADGITAAVLVACGTVTVARSTIAAQIEPSDTSQAGRRGQLVEARRGMDR
jgi:hypothetical protein